MDIFVNINSNVVFYKNCNTPLMKCPAVRKAIKMMPTFDSWNIRCHKSFVLSADAANMDFAETKRMFSMICGNCQMSKNSKQPEKVREQVPQPMTVIQNLAKESQR